jgi:AcrR family transcriptional regulator
MAARNRKRSDEIRAKSRKAIMDSALELFCEKGYHGTSVSMIANKAGVSTGLMYNYFTSKEELLEGIIIEGVGLIESSFDGLRELEDPHQLIEALVDNVFRMMGDEEWHFWKLYFSMLMQADLPESVRNLFSGFASRTFADLESTFKKLGASHPAAEARLFAALGDGIILHYWLGERSIPQDVLKGIILNKYLRESQAKRNVV